MKRGRQSAFRLGLALVASLASASCRRSPQNDGRAPDAATRSCDQELSGVWVNASDERFAYRLRDHGSVVRGEFFRREADGGAARPGSDDEPILIELHRTPGALAGTMRSTESTESGRRCPIEFGLRVRSCAGGALQVVAETEYGLREDCSRARSEDGGEGAPRLVEYRWERQAGGSTR